MNISKKEASILSKYLAIWKDQGLLDETTHDKLQNSFTASFDWTKFLKITAFFALTFLLIALAALLEEDFIEKLLRQTPPICRAIGLFICALLLFYGSAKCKKKPLAFIMDGLACIALPFGAWNLAIAVGNEEGFLNALFCILSVFYCIFAWREGNVVIWTSGILAATFTVFAETSRLCNYNAYFLGLNYPLRLFFVGLILFVFYSLKKEALKLKNLGTSTLIFALLFMAVSLLTLSFFGMTDLDYHKRHTLDVTIFSLLSGIAFISSIIYGIKIQDSLFVRFGVSFLLLEVFLKYFEHCWDYLHKSVFFAILFLVCIVIILCSARIRSFFHRKSLL